MSINGLIDTLMIRKGLLSSLQSCSITTHISIDSEWLAACGEAYFVWLERLPGIGVARGLNGERAIQAVGLHLPLLRFAAPYVAESLGGRELRYPIGGGLMTGVAGGWLAFGCRMEANELRLWVEVRGYHPRLGTGWFYQSTQARCHRWITLAFLRTWATHTGLHTNQ